MVNHLKRITKIPTTIDIIEELILRKEYYFKKVNSTTLEWIKAQPYLTRFNIINNQYILSLTEECFSKS